MKTIPFGAAHTYKQTNKQYPQITAEHADNNSDSCLDFPGREGGKGSGKIVTLPYFCQPRRGILEQLNAGELIVGDGGMTYALEKRGYVKAGVWTPECTVEHPEAGLLRAMEY